VRTGFGKTITAMNPRTADGSKGSEQQSTTMT
jgi:hypothetical protein